MSYSKNPYLPKVRTRAVRMVKAGKSIRLTSRYFGVNASTVSRWVNSEDLPTLASRPKNPKTISPAIAAEIIKLRSSHTLGGVIKKLADQGVKISLSSVKRIINRGR